MFYKAFFALCLCHVFLLCSASTLKIDDDFILHVTPTGSYSFEVNGRIWLVSADTFLQSNGSMYSTANRSLILKSTYYTDGSDELGPWIAVNYLYSIQNDPVTLFECRVLQYENTPAYRFTQTFKNGVNGTLRGGDPFVSSAFPSFYVSSSSQDPLGFVSYGNDMTGDTGKKIGVWDNSTSDLINDGLKGGPLILFDKNGYTLVFSSMSNFMSASFEYHPGFVYMGVMGTATSISKDFTMDFILYYSRQGINKAMQGWGQALTTFYGKSDYNMKNDPTINYLAYWTDEGAFYYWNTEQSQNYETTIFDVVSNFTALDIPYRYIQYDSWWYGGPLHGACVEWYSPKSVFPHGIEYIYENINLHATAHSRYWSAKVVYAKQNGGKYNFIIDNSSMLSLPNDQTFWDDLFLNASRWGLHTYEQDWLIKQTGGFAPMLSDVQLGRTWLLQMGNGAAKNNMTILYCMGLSRHILQSLEIPSVTQARVSTDYDNSLYGTTEQWRIGISSIFAHAVNLAPFKDVFWTTEVQPGNVYGNVTEPHPELQAAVATLSTGPVGPGDKIGLMNKTLIMRCCNDDGLILKPSKPITSIDDQIYRMAFDPKNQNNSGEAWSTYSQINNYTFGIILGADIHDPYIITPNNSGFYSDSNTLYWKRDNMNNLNQFQNTLKLDSSCTKKEFCLYYTTPLFIIKNVQIVFLGEYNKWVPVSPQRVIDIYTSTEMLIITVQGVLNEQVAFAFNVANTYKEVLCVFETTNHMKIVVANNSLICV